MARARENYARSDESFPGGVTILYGPSAMRTLAADLRAAPERPLGGLPYFKRRVSGQRCLDSAVFLRKRLPEAAAVRWEECQLYGKLQQATAAGERARMAELLDRLADHEARFIAAIG